MMRESLAVSGLNYKPHVARLPFWQACGVSQDLSVLFAKRLQEEMKARRLSDNGLGKLAVVGQRSVSRILLPVGHKDRQVPSLAVVDKLAGALHLPPWYLMIEASEAQREVIQPPEPPRQMPRYPQTFTRQSGAAKNSQSITRKASRQRYK